MDDHGAEFGAQSPGCKSIYDHHAAKSKMYRHNAENRKPENTGIDQITPGLDPESPNRNPKSPEPKPGSFGNSPDSLVLRHLEEIVVSARRVAVDYSDALRSIQVITRSNIYESPADDIASLLAAIRSVDIRSRGTFGMQSDVSIRGGTFDQTLILLNGVNVSDPQTGHHNLNVPVDMQSIERIEVLRGPGARIFGPNAFNGAVNIITVEPGEHRMTTSLAAGQHAFGSLSAAGGFSSGPIAHHVSVYGVQSDGFIDNTDFRSGSIFYRSRINVATGLIDFQSGYSDKAFGANSFYTPRFPDQYERTRSVFASAKYLPGGGLRMTPTVYWRRHYDRFELFRHEKPDWYDGHNYHRSDIIGGSINRVHSNDYGVSSIGADYRLEHIYSNVLGIEMDQPRQIRGFITTDEALYSHSYQRHGLGLMLEHSITHGSILISGGALIYNNSDLDPLLTLFPGLDIGWQLHESVQWYATANRTLRLPTFTDLFYSGPDNVGNSGLKPEIALSLETGLKANLGHANMDVAIFRRWGSNSIDWIRRPEDDFWQSANHTKVTYSGFEAGVTVPLNFELPSIKRIKSIVFKPVISIDYSWLHAEKSSGEYFSNYAMDHLRQKLDVILNIPLAKSSGINTNVTWRDRAGGYLPFEDGAYTEFQPFKAYWLVDAKAYWNVGSLNIFMEVLNAGNVSYVHIGNVPQPGRWVRAGITYTFPFRS